MTNDLIRRIGEHRHGQIDGYSPERGTDRLVWYEHHRSSIRRSCGKSASNGGSDRGNSP
jgi:predicted GIY-YIG superfamily endonuclease